MLTFQSWALRFPNFFEVNPELFDLLLEDATIEMGLVEDRWVGMYNKAMANLVSHYYVINQQQALGDSNAMAPLRRTEVEDVVVELAMPKETGSTAMLYENFASTSYGQEYARLRRIAFAGPRVAVP